LTDLASTLRLMVGGTGGHPLAPTGAGAGDVPAPGSTFPTSQAALGGEAPEPIMTFHPGTSLLTLALLAAGLAWAPAPALAQSGTSYQVTGNLRVDGGSTVRSWSCEATSLDAQVAGAPGASLALRGLDGAVQSLRLEIPSGDLDCDNDTMNDHMWSALQTRDHPRILFQMQGYTVASPGGSAAQVELRGQLAMAGSTQPITLRLEATEEANGRLRVQGVHELNMTRWGIRPPRLMLGTLRVHEDVQIHFDLLLSPR